MNYLAVFGVLSSVVSLAATIIYVRDILRNETRPERAAWWIWALVNGIALWAQLAAGASWSAILAAALTFAAVVSAVLSLKYGYGTFKRKDFISILAAVFGVVLWQLTNQPFVALLMVFFIDFLGYWLTYVKTWEAPFTESYLAYVIAVAASVFAIMSAGEFNLVILFYPVYIFLCDAALLVIMSYRRRLVPAPAHAK